MRSVYGRGPTFAAAGVLFDSYDASRCAARRGDQSSAPSRSVGVATVVDVDYVDLTALVVDPVSNAVLPSPRPPEAGERRPQLHPHCSRSLQQRA
jgi:hypothetical protein